ncbi:hypothetical protein [Actinokineospora globicatena]|uniref:hypothetical protein n=1 Tax=Actinokineospora globicatena TaxID=103729 RepID=UPI0020A315B3|nr:hypothetical protein [Actinokineospora globicatena]MCP2303740.1 hypothetical protein [Actinokineospora globicatena]GLW79111.1 hypothetical protein Aglo01_35930 [Actinokineospora globicatena]GLW86479.1 hypothetical protein Aglo02_41180 [Actinokineospora globicatena]
MTRASDRVIGTVVVLDPADTATHGALPGTWREFARTRDVRWIGQDEDAPARVEHELAGVDGAVALVAAGTAADTALAVAQRRPENLVLVLLVDPGAAGTVPGAPALAANEEWMHRMTRRRADLAAEDIDVRLVAVSTGGSEDRVTAPLPLGHPDVVVAVESALSHPTRESADPEDFAESVGIDPTPDQVDEYRARTEHP